MQMQTELKILEVYKYNNKNYITGTILSLIGCNEFILSENKNLLYEVPQYILDDLYYNMPNLEVIYYSIKPEQIKTIYTMSTISKTIDNSNITFEDLDTRLEYVINKQKENVVQEILNWFEEEYKKNISDEQKIKELLKMTEPIVRQKVEKRYTKNYEVSTSKLAKKM